MVDATKVLLDLLGVMPDGQTAVARKRNLLRSAPLSGQGEMSQ
jgi:hypothetical protein